MTSATQKLMRSRTDRMIAGVASGIGQYMALDPVIVRLVFVVLAMSGIGLVIYLILWIIMPLEPRSTGSAETWSTYATPVNYPGDDPYDPDQDIPIHNIDPSNGSSTSDTRIRRNRTLGVVLLGVGAFLLIGKFLPWIAPFLIPALLVGIGVFLLRRAT